MAESNVNTESVASLVTPPIEPTEQKAKAKASSSLDSSTLSRGSARRAKRSGRAGPRQVNPLRRGHCAPVALIEEWPKGVVDCPTLRWVADLGSGDGAWCRRASLTTPKVNFLGLEVREMAVEAAALEGIGGAGARNCAFARCNVSVDGPAVLARLPGPLVALTIQFGDPWFRRREAKRRMLTPTLAIAIGAALAPGGLVYVVSDVEALAREQVGTLEETGLFDCLPADDGGTAAAEAWRQALGEREAGEGGEGGGRGALAEGLEGGAAGATWLGLNPTGCATEREDYVSSRGGSCYRALLSRRTEPRAPRPEAGCADGAGLLEDEVHDEAGADGLSLMFGGEFGD